MKSYLKIFTLTVVVSAHCVSYQMNTTEAGETHRLTLSPEGLLFVSAAFEDTIAGNFILDTGAGVHVLSQTFFDKLTSTAAGSFTGFRHNGERLDFMMYRVETLNIGGRLQHQPLVAVWPALDSFHIDGIISLKFFEHIPATINLKDTTLTFESAASLTALMQHSTPIPIRIDNIRGKALDMFVDARAGDSLRLECIIDTGSPTTIIDARYMKALGIDSTSATISKRERKSQFGVTETEYVSTISSLGLWGDAATVVNNRKILFKNRLIYGGLLGIDFLRTRSLTIDIPGGKILLTP